MKEANSKRLAADVQGLAASNKKQVCCICGKEIEGYDNNPAPYKNRGRCCDKCNRDYVLPSRMYLMGLGSNLTDKEVKKALSKFRKHYRVFPYNCYNKLILEIGERIVKGICEKGLFKVTSMKTDTLIDGATVPIGTMSKSEAIECMVKYLATIGKTLDSWIQETGYNLYWDRVSFVIAEKERMEETGRSCSDTAFVEPLIDNDSDFIERMAESANVEVTDNVAST